MREPAARIGLVLLSLVAALGLGEAALRARRAVTSGPEPEAAAGVPLHVRVDTPELYALNPAHESISPQGLRNSPVSIPKPRGVLRILVLGDSITYGPAVKAERAFPARLAALMSSPSRPVEVINAGVPGYTPYNELGFYRHKGRVFDADVVVVVFCLNDIANPRLHWDEYAKLGDIPDAAIPNRDYDRDVIQPRIARRAGGPGLLHQSLLFDLVARRIAGAHPEAGDGRPDLTARPPTFITGEDDISIERLLDAQTPEWQWLAATYRELRAAVEADGADFAVAIVPLAYQLDGDYPFRPQKVFAEFCRREGIPCVDLLPALRVHPKEQLFLMDRLGVTDVWHLTDLGHDVVARQLLLFFDAHPGLGRGAERRAQAPP